MLRVCIYILVLLTAKGRQKAIDELRAEVVDDSLDPDEGTLTMPETVLQTRARGGKRASTTRRGEYYAREAGGHEEIERNERTMTLRAATATENVTQIRRICVTFSVQRLRIAFSWRLNAMYSLRFELFLSLGTQHRDR